MEPVGTEILDTWLDEKTWERWVLEDGPGGMVAYKLPAFMRPPDLDETTRTLPPRELVGRALDIASRMSDPEGLKYARSLIFQAAVNSQVRPETLPPLTDDQIFEAGDRIDDLWMQYLWDRDHLRARFRKRVAAWIPGARFCNPRARRYPRPDCWVLLDGRRYPVQISPRRFTAWHAARLREVMDAHGCERGFAVAPEPEAPLAAGMSYVQCR